MADEVLKKETLEHYDRMIKQAKKQWPKGRPNRSLMEKNLKENWYGEYCPYCIAYKNKCSECELKGKLQKNEILSVLCCDKLWYKMVISDTWEEWIEAAEKVKLYIKENG
jgi:hypothetical protein